MVSIQLIVSNQFKKIEVKLEIVIQLCALLAANGGFGMGTSKLNKLYLELNCYISIFYIVSLKVIMDPQQ